MNGREAEPPSPLELALACLMVALEDRDPGLSDRWVKHAESDALHAEVRRLHSQAPNPALMENLRSAMGIARHIRFIVKSHAPSVPQAKAEEPARRKRKGRG